MNLDKLKNWFDSPEAEKAMDEWLEEKERKDIIKNARYQKFEIWCELESFDELMQRLKKEHDVTYRHNCYKKGYMPNPNNKLSFVFDYVFENQSSIIDTTVEDYVFSTDMRFFKGYHFVKVFGQGVIYSVYKDKEQFLQV